MGFQGKWVALAFVLTAGMAHADYGYVYARVHGGTSPTVNATYSLNPNGPITVAWTGTGAYTVTFANSGIGPGWAALATSVDPNPPGVYCNMSSWGGGAAYVACFDPGGDPAESNFNVLALSNVDDKYILFAYANAPTTASYAPPTGYSYNPAGSIGISRSGTGAYQVAFNGLTGSGGTVQVVTYGSNAICNSNGWASSMVVSVQCSNPRSGNPVDAQFVIAAVAPIANYGVIPAGLAFSYISSDGSSSTNYNPTGLPASVSRVSTGLYTVTFDGLASVPVSGGTVLATADGTVARCSLLSMTSSSSSFALSITILCTDEASNTMDTSFELLALPPSGYAYAAVSASGVVNGIDSVNPGGVAITASHSATGQYAVSFPNSSVPYGWVFHGFALGETANWCEVVNWAVTTSAPYVNVECFTPAGTAVDAQFGILGISTTNQQSMAFAVASQPSAGSYTPDPHYSYNPAGTISVTRLSVGSYSVVFNGLNAGGGTVQVSAVVTLGTCYSGGWNVPEFTAKVYCVNSSGNPADTEFVITVIPQGATPSGLAYAWADQPTAASYSALTGYSFDSSGAVTIARSSTGNYSLTFPGISGVGGINQVTAYNAIARCSTQAGTETSLECFNLAGQPADEEYEVLVLAPIAGMPFFFNPPVGVPQSAPAGTQFANPLVAVPVDLLFSPLNGVYVTFTAPASGASGTFAGGLTSVTVQTSNGTAQAPALTANDTQGPYNVTATIASYPGDTSPMIFTMVNAAPVLQSITVTPADPTVAQGEHVAFTATGHYSDGSTQDLTQAASWSSNVTAVATISSGGVATVVASSGGTKIQASQGGVLGFTNLDATQPVLVSIAVTPANPAIAKGLTQQFTATGTYTDSSTQNLTSQVTWSSATTTVATITASGGLATAVGAGTSNITAGLNGVTSPADVLTVTAATLVSIAVTPSNPSIAKRLTQQFTATGTYTDSTTQNLTSQVTWASATTTVATITASGGLATAVGAGTSNITAGLNGVTSPADVLTVTAATLVSIVVTPANPSIGRGLTQQFAATGTYTDKSTQNLTSQVTWSSATTTVATITASGGLATGTGMGTSNITASLSGVTSPADVLTVTAATLVSIAVTPASPSIAKGLTQQFTATGTFTDSSTQNLTSQVTWSSATTTVATITASGGLATAVGAGTSNITAGLNGVTSPADVLTVTAATLVSIAVTPANPSIGKGLTQQFTATGTYTDTSTQNLTGSVTWNSGTTATATINTSGLATAVASGNSTITATSGSVNGSTTLTVTGPALVSIAVTPANPTLGKGQTLQFTATGTYSDNSTLNLTGSVTWTSSQGAAIITAGGLATGESAGTCTITATLGAIQGSTMLTAVSAVLQSIAVTPGNPTVTKGQTLQFTATGTYTDNTVHDLTGSATWSSGTTATATVVVGGLASAVNAGTSTITATSGTIQGSTTMTVTTATLVSIAVTPANPTLAKGATQQFTAIGTYSDKSTADLTASVTWASGNGNVNMYTSGLATAKAVGTATIGASFNQVTGTTLVTVAAATLVSIAVTPANPPVAKGLTQQFTATGTYTDSSTQNLTASVTWGSGTTATATITSGGLATAVAVGTSTITAASGSIQGSTTMTVSASALVSIAVTPVNPSVAKGLTQQFTATGTYADSSTQNLTGSVTWSSGTPGSVTITSGGLATTVAVGTSTITATSGTIQGSTTMTVTGPALVSIAVTPSNPSVPKGMMLQFTATGTYTDSSTQNLTGFVTWASGTPGTVTISTGGLATAEALGMSIITASSGSIQGSTTMLSSNPCDVTGGGSVTVADIQLVINEALGIAPAANDLNHSGAVNVVDVQVAINAALMLGCQAM